MKDRLIRLICILSASAIIGLGIYGHSIKEEYVIKNACYQGYHHNSQLVFDPKPRTERGGRPEHIFQGDPNKLELKIGEHYNLEVGKPHFPWLYSERIIDVEESDSTNKI